MQGCAGTHGPILKVLAQAVNPCGGPHQGYNIGPAWRAGRYRKDPSLVPYPSFSLHGLLSVSL